MKKDLLTKKDILDLANNLQYVALARCCGKEITNRIMAEMLEYKTIEEKLGIDLPTYFKYAEAKTAFSKEKYGDQECIEECYVTGITLEGIILMPKAFPYGECEFTRKFKDYGIAWALDRKELN